MGWDVGELLMFGFTQQWVQIKNEIFAAWWRSSDQVMFYVKGEVQNIFVTVLYYLTKLMLQDLYDRYKYWNWMLKYMVNTTALCSFP